MGWQIIDGMACMRTINAGLIINAKDSQIKTDTYIRLSHREKGKKNTK